MTTVSILLVFSSLSLIVWQAVYFRRQRNKCQKYPFYKLRDDIVWHLATSDPGRHGLDVYDLVNWSISRLKYFNFAFHAEMITQITHAFIEKGYNGGFDPTQFKRQEKPFELQPFESRFVRLVLSTARNNSILIRLSTTHFGYVVLIAGSFPRAFSRFRCNHPELLRRDFSHIKTLRQYSMVNHLVAQST